MEEQQQQYLVISNRKKQNLGTLIRTASAFNVAEIILVGQSKYGTHGAHGAHKHVRVQDCKDFQDAKAYLQQRDCYSIYGVEYIDEISSAVHTARFHGSSAAFVIATEGPLSPEQKSICSAGFLHIQPFTPDSEGELEINVSTAIVLQTFATDAGFEARSIELSESQGKFTLDDVSFSGLTQSDIERAVERERNRKNELQDASLGVLFDFVE